jgi:di/tripeptidase
VADYLEQFAKERGLYCYRDGLHNVLIKAPATKGWEDCPWKGDYTFKPIE